MTPIRPFTFTPEAARRVYDRIGRRQDSQRFYEDPAIARLVERSNLPDAQAVFELGCGTGRLAEHLLSGVVSSDARYHGVDVSPRMVHLTRSRLERWSGRVTVDLVDGEMPLPGRDGGYDRIMATYVFDLLSPDDTACALAEARRLLQPGGLLCLAGMTGGDTAVARLVDRAWIALWRRAPAVVGGCRPVDMAPILAARGWRLQHHDVVTAWARSSEIVIAQPQ